MIFSFDDASCSEEVFSDLALARVQLSEALDLSKQLLKFSVSKHSENISELVRRVQHLEDELQQQKSENNVIRLQNQNLRVLLTKTYGEVVDELLNVGERLDIKERELDRLGIMHRQQCLTKSSTVESNLLSSGVMAVTEPPKDAPLASLVKQYLKRENKMEDQLHRNASFLEEGDKQSIDSHSSGYQRVSDDQLSTGAPSLRDRRDWMSEGGISPSSMLSGQMPVRRARNVQSQDISLQPGLTPLYHSLHQKEGIVQNCTAGPWQGNPGFRQRSIAGSISPDPNIYRPVPYQDIDSKILNPSIINQPRAFLSPEGPERKLHTSKTSNHDWHDSDTDTENSLIWDAAASPSPWSKMGSIMHGEDFSKPSLSEESCCWYKSAARENGSSSQVVLGANITEAHSHRRGRWEDMLQNNNGGSTDGEGWCTRRQVYHPTPDRDADLSSSLGFSQVTLLSGQTNPCASTTAAPSIRTTATTGIYQ